MKFYSKIDNESKIEPSIIFLITSHHPPCQLNRTWRLNVSGHKIFICTRCFGQYIGIGLGILLILLGFEISELAGAILFFGFLPLPATLDWTTQTVMGRESKNTLRIMTGFLFGVSIGAFLGAIFRFNLRALLFALPMYSIYIGSVLWLFYGSNIMEDYLAPYEQYLSSSSDSQEPTKRPPKTGGKG
ncbi:MAG: DUF2085 domain-containing protein [Anaerolineales bacterium]|nr:DUF2085 domain-containing protein [Anaerolineales bacterium]